MKFSHIFGILIIGQAFLIVIYEILRLLYVDNYGEINSVTWGISYRVALVTYFFIVLLVMILSKKYRKYSKLFFGIGFVIFSFSLFPSRIEGAPYYIFKFSYCLSYLFTYITMVYFDKKKEI